MRQPADVFFFFKAFLHWTGKSLVRLEAEVHALELLSSLRAQLFKQKEHDVCNIAFDKLVYERRSLQRAYYWIDLVGLCTHVFKHVVDRF